MNKVQQSQHLCSSGFLNTYMRQCTENKHTAIMKFHSRHLNSGCPLLWWYNPNWGPSGDREARVQRLGECGVNSVKERHLTGTSDAIERQAPCLMVQTHSYSRGARCWYFGSDFTMPKGATRICKWNAPGLVCVSKATFYQLYPFMAHSDLNPGPLPFNLPVTNAR